MFDSDLLNPDVVAKVALAARSVCALAARDDDNGVEWGGLTGYSANVARGEAGRGGAACEGAGTLAEGRSAGAGAGAAESAGAEPSEAVAAGAAGAAAAGIATSGANGTEGASTDPSPSPELMAALAHVFHSGALDPGSPLRLITRDQALEIAGAFQWIESWAAAGLRAAAAAVNARAEVFGDSDWVEGRAVMTGPGVEELAVRLGLSHQRAGALAGEGNMLAGVLQPARDAMVAGVIDAGKASALAGAVVDQPLEVCLAVCDSVLPEAPVRNHHAFSKLVERAVIEADPATAAERHCHARRRRFLGRVRVRADGMAQLMFYAPLRDVVAVDQACESAARAAHANGDPRTLEQLRADALTTMAVDSIARGGMSQDPHFLATLLETVRKMPQNSSEPPWSVSAADPAPKLASPEVATAPPDADAAPSDAATHPPEVATAPPDADAAPSDADTTPSDAATTPPDQEPPPLPMDGTADRADWIPRSDTDAGSYPAKRVERTSQPDPNGSSAQRASAEAGPAELEAADTPVQPDSPRVQPAAAASTVEPPGTPGGSDPPASPDHREVAREVVNRLRHLRISPVTDTFDAKRRVVLRVTREQLRPDYDTTDYDTTDYDTTDYDTTDYDTADDTTDCGAPGPGPGPANVASSRWSPLRWPKDPAAELLGFGPVAPAVARDLVQDPPQWLRVQVHESSGAANGQAGQQDPGAWPIGRCPGPHPYGYEIPAAVRREVHQTFPTCVAPMCGTPATRCDLDHTLEWPVGPTCRCNLRPLCRRHHRLKTHGGFGLKIAPDGTMTWSTPMGQQFHSYPDGTFRVTRPPRRRSGSPPAPPG